MSRWTELCPKVEPGEHVVFVSSTDEHTRLEPNHTGVVQSIDDLGTIHVAWGTDGHMLGLIPGVDVWRLLHARWDGEHAPMYESKFCPHCKQSRPVRDFARRRRGSEDRQGWCRDCINESRRGAYARARGNNDGTA